MPKIPMHKIPTHRGTLLLFALLGAACGSEDASESAGTVSANAALERAKTFLEDPQEMMAEVLAASRDVVELPSHRRLKAFLPTSLPGIPNASLESEQQPNSGKSLARGRYQPDAADFLSGVQVEITYFGKPLFNGLEQSFGMAGLKHIEIAGFDAIVIENDYLGKTSFEISVRLSPELWVEVTGRSPYETVRDAAAAVDLKTLAEQLANRKLFEDTDGDRLQSMILTADALKALLPASIGPLEQGSANGHALFESEPLHSWANGTYAAGQFTLYDYGDAEIAGTIELAAAQLRGFKMYTAGQSDGVQEGPLEVADGRGSWAYLQLEPPRHRVVALHLARGRFVMHYTGRFVAAPPELDESLPADLRETLIELQRETGAGAFETIDAQRDAVLTAFEALQLDAFDN